MLKEELRALLFSSGRKMEVTELAKLTHKRRDTVEKALAELKDDYENGDKSIMLINEGIFWKLAIQEQYLPLVQQIVTETELSKTVMETLAVIAFKYPIKQSDLIKIRTNKAYDHLKELEDMGYISRQKYGRSNLIKLTQKFFDYFALTEESLKEKFSSFQSIAKAIEAKEQEFDKVREEQREVEEDVEGQEDKIKEQIDMLDEEGNEVPVDTYGEKPQESPIEGMPKEHLGDLEVVDEPDEAELAEERERIAKAQSEDDEDVEDEPKKTHHAGTVPTIKHHTKEKMAQEVDKRIDAMMHPPEEKEEKPKAEHEETPAEQGQDLLEASIEEQDDSDHKKEQKDTNSK